MDLDFNVILSNLFLAMCFVEKVMAKGFNYCCFDFSGAGLSQGKYVSLGYHEKYDIQAVLEHITSKFNIKKFILWGRSMGAAAAIKFMSLNSSSSNYTSTSSSSPRHPTNNNNSSTIITHP